MSGDRWADHVLSVARAGGWVTAHFRPAQTQTGRWITPVGGDGKGFPDLILVHVGRGLVWYRECKRDGDTLRPEQANWGATLQRAGADWAVWDEKDWRQIHTELVQDAVVRSHLPMWTTRNETRNIAARQRRQDEQCRALAGTIDERTIDEDPP